MLRGIIHTSTRVDFGIGSTSLPPKRATRLLQERHQLSFPQCLGQLRSATNRLAIEYHVWDSFPPGELSKDLLHLTIPLLSTRIELNECVGDAGLIQCVLPLSGIWSIGLRKAQETTVSMRLNLLTDELTLLLKRHARQIRRKQRGWHVADA